jgi:Fe-S-cluster containining protein
VEPEVVTRLQNHPILQERGQVFRQTYACPLHPDINPDAAGKCPRCEREAVPKVYIQNSRDCPNCGFLDSDQLCSIHRQLGYAAKPATCKLFPFVMTQTPDGVYAGTTYYCTATRQNHGRPSSAHEEDLRQQLAQSAPINKVAADGLVVHNRYYISYRDYAAFEAELLRRAGQGGLMQAISLATLGLGCLMAELPDIEDDRIVAVGERLPELWNHPAMPYGSPVSRLQELGRSQLGDFFLFTLDKSLWPEVEAALDQGTPFSLPHFQWRGTFAELEKKVDSRFDSRIERYLEHLIWRKALVVHPGLLPSLCQLQMLPAFLKAYAGLLAHVREHEVDDQDYYDALENAETYLVTHGRNRRILHDWAADTLIGTLRG